MNTQRYIIIFFVVVVLSTAGYFAFRIYQTNQQDANRNQVISVLYEIGNDAQRYYEKPADKGGGGNSYMNWILPETFKRTQLGTFGFNARHNRVNLYGVGTITGRNGITNVRVTAQVDSSGIQVTIIN